MKKIKWIRGLFCLAVCHGVAVADSPSEGVRVGVQLGYGLLDSKVKASTLFPPPASDSSDISGRGAIGGFSIDWCGTIGNSDTLMGIEGSFNYITSKGKKSTQGTFVIDPTGGDLSTTVLFKRAYDVTFKVGYLLKGTALGYVKAGPSMGHWKAASVSNAFNLNGATSTTMLGFTMGIGAEFPLTERFSWGAECNYRTYRDFTHQLTTGAPTNLAVLSIGVKPSSTAIMLRLNYKMSAVDFATTPEKKERKRKKYRKPKNTEGG